MIRTLVSQKNMSVSVWKDLYGDQLKAVFKWWPTYLGQTVANQDSVEAL